MDIERDFKEKEENKDNTNLLDNTINNKTKTNNKATCETNIKHNTGDNQRCLFFLSLRESSVRIRTIQ